MKVLAAMSGGVDSSVAAARMVDAGHEVVGVHMALSTAPGTLRTGSRGCCSKEDAADARRVADVLGIPFYVWDFAEKFKEDVINDFVSSYARGNSEPLRAVQSADQVRCSVRQGCGVGFRYGGHRPLRPAVGWAAAPRRRPGQGSVLCACRAHCAAAAPRRVPDRRHAEAADPCRGGPPRPGGRQQAG